MQKGIIEASELPLNEKVYMKRSFGEWRVVYPIKNEDGTLNWFNLITGGTWLKLFTAIVVILMILGVAYEYTSNLQFCDTLINKTTNNNIKIYPGGLNISYLPTIQYDNQENKS